MNYFSYGTIVEFDLRDTKKLLELPKEDFYRYGDFSRELNLLMNSDRCYYNELISTAYKVISRKKRGLACFQKKAYRDFISKYIIFFEQFGGAIGIYGPWHRDKVYEILKENYENKDEILDMINKLLELGIESFKYTLSKDLNDDKLRKYKIDDETMDVITDGTISYGPSILDTSYPVSVADAKYIIECEKHKYFDYDISVNIKMVVSDLMFDVTTLPTYEELHDFDIKPFIDYEAAERATELKKQKDELVSQVLYATDTLEMAEKFMLRLNRLSEVFNDIPGEISKEKMQVIKELCAEVEALKDAVIAESVSEELMTEDEIKAEVKTKKRERDYGYYCSCC